MRSLARLPRKLEPDPGVGERRRNDQGRLPGGLRVGVPEHPGDPAVRRVRHAPNHLASRSELGGPGQCQRALDGLGRDRRPFGRPVLVGRPLRTNHHVGRGVGPDPDLLGGNHDATQPLDAVAPDPAGHHGAERKAVIRRQGGAVHAIREEGAFIECLSQRHRAAELGFVESDEIHVHRGVAHPGQLQHTGERGARPLRAADAPGSPLRSRRRAVHQLLKKAPPVPGAIEVGDDRTAGELEQVLVGELERPRNGIAFHAQAVAVQAEPRRRAGAPDEEQLSGCEKAPQALEAGLEIVAVLNERGRVLDVGPSRHTASARMPDPAPSRLRAEVAGSCSRSGRAAEPARGRCLCLFRAAVHGIGKELAAKAAALGLRVHFAERKSGLPALRARRANAYNPAQPRPPEKEVAEVSSPYPVEIKRGGLSGPGAGRFHAGSTPSPGPS